MSRWVVGSLAMLAFVGGAEAATRTAPTTVVAVEVKVGPALSTGFVSFKLTTSVNGDSLSVETVIDSAPLSASEKAALVAAAVAHADPTWRGAASGGTLTFQHLVARTWQNVDAVSSFNDTTGAGTKLQAEDTVVAFTLAMDEGAVAVGHDAAGGPSFITVSMTDTLSWTMALQSGDTPQVILDAFQVFLAAEAGEGVTVVRSSPNSLTVTLYYEESHVNWQVTDLGLKSAAKAEGVRLDDQAMLIRRGR